MTNEAEVKPFFPPCYNKWEAIHGGKADEKKLEQDDIPIEPLLQAVELLATFYDSMGSIFGKIKDELLGNVKKARDHIPAGVKTMKAGFEAEKAANAWKNDPGFCVGAYWMMNSLRFLVETLRNLKKDQKVGVGECVKDSYKQTLMKHHGFVLRTMFKGLLSAAVPNRKDLEGKLAPTPEQLQKDLEKFLEICTPYLDFCEAHNPHNEGK